MDRESHGNADGAKLGLPGEHVKGNFRQSMQKHSTSSIIYGAFGEKIKKCLKNPEVFSKEFRHCVKKKNFWLFEIPSI